MSSSSNRFSVSILPRKVKIYKCSKSTYDFIKTVLNDDDVMCKTSIEDEVTLIVYISERAIVNRNMDPHAFIHTILEERTTYDPRVYQIINIHEDIPGIDHIGIIANISRLFSEKGIPILYINTYSYNLILVSSEWKNNAFKVLKEIAYVDEK